MKKKKQMLKDKLRFLSEAMLILETLEEYEFFLGDILTNQEIEMIAQRLCIAIYLIEGKTFKEISLELGVSSTTIERVKQSVLYGDGGYTIVVDRIRSSLNRIFPINV